ncbi:uncharacterized protein C8Q71DRAFT_911922 [Rhodofomes roseus]|uniref:Protein kinase domain-containing protein n=1 Tax=Rhodofomes roseus TaxID=34475 RepID=A0ABQ8JYV1_9APHY|nr:uncharacterized protein C8Q71DRAFT_911922 [Rhodofomes roseus]KAH9829388.1 hypothetical protein C8Q71DRAFT_911922 [Rhodofomes roseus]
MEELRDSASVGDMEEVRDSASDSASDRDMEELRDIVLRKALSSHCMSRLNIQGAGRDDSQDTRVHMLHDLIDITDHSYPKHLHTSDDTDLILYLHKLKSAKRDESGTVICKMAVSTIGGVKILQHEAKIYEAPNTQPLHGNIMPKYFGLFQGTVEGQTVTCMVLEFCGEVLSRRLREQKESFRKAAIRAFQELHSERIHLVKGDREDYKYQDIIRRPDGTPCLVDFSRARPHIGKCHDAEFEFEDYKTPTHWPTSDLVCGELLAVADDAWVFVGDMLNIPDASGPIYYYQGISLEEHWERNKEGFVRYTKEEALTLLESVIEKYEEMLNKRRMALDKVEEGESI